MNNGVLSISSKTDTNSILGTLLKSLTELKADDKTKAEENKAKEEEKDTSIFEKKELGGNGVAEYSTTADVEDALKEIANVSIKGDNYSEVLKTKTQLESQKDKLELKQEEDKNNILTQFTDALKFGKSLSADAKSLIKGIENEETQRALLKQYQAIKDAQKEEEKEQPVNLDLVQ